ncbi:GNAT family N-acetyltransferase [Sphingobium sp. H39-3-25]|uniref:GNAT family N-acetyltransferase n=1 Tax=Sphingobium arseniciresistens TaxID=3030834 RepID=UPI0023B97E3C|nr:GNAT family N-acetyltransferase [Sphingobium arseniciresistens]
MIETERLILRGWRDEDVVPWQAICSDPEVMRHLGALMTMDDARAYVTRMQAMLAEHGHCFWAMERREDGALLGFCGLKPGAAGTPIAGLIEIGWRMGTAYWGKGYAREAAQASLDWGFAHLPPDSIWAITTPANVRSQGLMLRLGMVRRHDMDFEHEGLPAGDPQRPHVTFEAKRGQMAGIKR